MNEATAVIINMVKPSIPLDITRIISSYSVEVEWVWTILIISGDQLGKECDVEIWKSSSTLKQIMQYYIQRDLDSSKNLRLPDLNVCKQSEQYLQIVKKYEHDSTISWFESSLLNIREADRPQFRYGPDDYYMWSDLHWCHHYFVNQIVIGDLTNDKYYNRLEIHYH